jgi:hypothetical protein
MMSVVPTPRRIEGLLPAATGPGHEERLRRISTGTHFWQANHE